MLEPTVRQRLLDAGGEWTDPRPVQQALLAVAEALGGGPDQAYGTPLTVRWRRGPEVVDVQVGVRLLQGALAWRVQPRIADARQTDRDEHSALDNQYPDGDFWTPPYLWNLRLGERWVTDLLPQPGNWDDCVDALGSTWGRLPAELAALPPAWFAGPIVHRVGYAGDLSVRAEPAGLTVAIPDVQMSFITPGTYRLDPAAALRGGRLAAQTVASMFSPDFPIQDIELSASPDRRTFQGIHPRSWGQPSGRTYESQTEALAELAAASTPPA